MNKEATESLLRSTKAVAVLSASLGALAGAAASAAVALKYFEKKYAAISEEEIADAKEFYKRYNKAEEFATPAGAASVLLEDAAEALQQYAGNHTQIGVVKSVIVTEDGVEAEVEYNEIGKNIFTDAAVTVDDEFDPTVQVRDPERPYVISYEEFREGYEDFNQVTMTYYAEDGVLTDDQDGVVEDEDAMVGDDNLTQFGVGSQDHSIVYVRNEKLELDMCVQKSQGSYSHVVGGIIEHSDTRVRRFRTYDD